MLDKFAEELKAQREKSGITIQQLSNKTRIDQKFIEAIELGNFSFLPDLYVKAFIKQYAKTVGLDEEATLKKFEASKEGKEYNQEEKITETSSAGEHSEANNTQETESSQQEEKEQESDDKPPAKSTTPLKSYVDEPTKSLEDDQKVNKQIMMFGLASVGLLIVAALLYFFIFSNNDKIVVEETPIDEVIQQSHQRYEENQPDEKIVSDSTAGLITANSDSLRLTFYAKEKAWIFVVLDNKKTQEFTLNPNSKFTISAANEFKATIGNSGGVSLQLNDEDVGFTGRSGAIRYIKLDKNGLIYLNTPPKIEP